MKKPLKGNGKQVTKPFLKGTPTDRTVIRKALSFFGAVVLTCVMTFFVCSVTGFDNTVLRYAANLAILGLTWIIYFNFGSSQGTAAVKHGEILYKRQEQGSSFPEEERKECFHESKGYIIALIGSLPLLLLCVFFALKTTKTTTGPGILPQWVSNYTNRSEVGNALETYLNPAGMGFIDLLRVIVRILVMPFMSLFGKDSSQAALTVERLSPLMMLLPAVCYGTGYLTGVSQRTQVHTEIAENRTKYNKRIRREKKKALSRENRNGPKMLN